VRDCPQYFIGVGIMMMVGWFLAASEQHSGSEQRSELNGIG